MPATIRGVLECFFFGSSGFTGQPLHIFLVFPGFLLSGFFLIPVFSAAVPVLRLFCAVLLLSLPVLNLLFLNGLFFFFFLVHRLM